MRKKILGSLVGLSLVTAAATANAAWTEVPLGSRCVSMGFPTALVGYSIHTAIPYTTLEKTIDGGKTWKTVTQTSAKKVSSYAGGGTAILFTDALTGFSQVEEIITIDLAKTTDGGVTWKAKTITGLATGATIRSVMHLSFSTKMDGAVVVSTGGGTGIGSDLAVTHDGGETWNTVSRPASTTNYGKVGMLDPSTLVTFAVYPVTGGGMTGVYTSHDGGATWKKNYEASTSEPFTQLEVVDAKHAFITKQCPGPAAVTNDCVLATSDGGDTWAPTTTVYLGNGKQSSMAWADLTHGLIGSGGDILKTIDGGKTWTKETLPAGHLDDTPCLAYVGPGAVSGGYSKPYMIDEGAGGGPRPELPPGGTTTADAGADTSATDATTTDASTADASASDVATTDARSADAIAIDTAPTVEGGTSTDAGTDPAGGDGGDGGGCSTSPRQTSTGWSLALIAAGLIVARRRTR
jgi:MYXO-CTERM domain-containing protein